MKTHITVLLGDMQKHSPNWFLAEHAHRIISLKASSGIVIPELPLFSKEYERPDQEPVHPAVEELRHSLRSTDGVLVCAPEYNCLPSPVILNALLWASRDPLPPLENKPVMLAGASLGLDGTRCARDLLQTAAEATGARVLQSGIFVSRGEETFASSRDIALLQEDLQEKLSELLRRSQNQDPLQPVS